MLALSLFISALSFLSIVTPSCAKKNPKRGLAFAESDNPRDLFQINHTDSAVSWVYNWGDAPPYYLSTSGLEYIPMQWGRNNIARFPQTAKGQKSRHILGFNEPDFSTQANMPPAEAAALWKQYIQPLKAAGFRLGAPAVTSAPWGRPWLADFFKACNGCTFDFVPVHWYGEGVQNFLGYLAGFHKEFPQYPIWVTEYADTSSNDATVAQFMRTSIQEMDKLAWVERYAWFAFFRKESNSHYNLLNADGSLSTLGQIYVSY